ncbi:putative resolvase [Cafeteria roenbergensis virus]|uniref:Putative resolvase n=1 Tax=Cafeteria roenbergensis virus (strain BV-PW1) TaxID=693272 RepID=E3T5C8_CROVB|nr:transposase [Cafeteria roenbergensis virus BV-PW1]ADO67391.1 putative resolvase [Cafeteria roenbergensis virus BV-PW1]
MDEYLGGKEASKILGVHQRTLMNWDRKGLIETKRTPGNKRLYNIKKFIGKNNYKLKCKSEECDIKVEEISQKINISYVRVSTYGQKDDLERQKIYMENKYPKNKIISDIGSGINFNRKGLLKIIELAVAGKINKIYIAHKDRLARFGYELIDFIVKKYSKGEIIIINKEEEIEPEEEMVKDILQIMNVFTAKMNGLRKYKKSKYL